MNLPETIDQSIFRAYDIRGLADPQLTPEVAYAIGRGFGTTLRELYDIKHPTVIVGRDARLSGPALQEALTKGLMECGCEVINIGMTPSPINYFTICTTRADGGVHITASHNPAPYNGCKLQIREAHPYSGDDLQKLYTKIVQIEFVDGEGSQRDFDALSPYRTYLANTFNVVGEGLKVVVDAGNGIAGPAYCNVLSTLGCDVVELYTKPDGTFPNHDADPSQHDTLRELQAKVSEEQADIGFAFDGDGDRVGVIDEQGEIRTPDEVLLILSKDHLDRFPGATIVATINNSSTFLSEVAAWGGKPIMCKVGHSIVEHTMLEHDSLLGGEISSHFFCGEEYFPFDDALVASLRLIKIIKNSGKTIGQLSNEFPKVFQMPGVSPYCADDKKTEIIKQISNHFSKNYEVNTLDGARIDFGNGAWAGVRQSNTSPCIRICAEARSKADLERMKHEVFDHLATYPEIEL